MNMKVMEVNYEVEVENEITDLVTLKNSCPFKQNFILFGLISQEISLPLVPFGTLTSMKTSSIVCAQFPQEVFDGTTPLFSSK